MKLLMLKLLMTTSILSTSLFAGALEDKIYEYEKSRLDQNQNIQLQSIKLYFKKHLKDEWNGYVYDLKIKVKSNNKVMDVKDTLFSNGTVVVPELKDLKTGLDYKRMMHPTLDKRYTTKEKLIAGNFDAEHKLVVFSDPLCPTCTTVVPDIIETVQAHPTKLALFYVSFPLDMHPSARVLSIAASIAKIQGVKNVKHKLYNAQFETFYDVYKQDKNTNTNALNAFNKVFKTNISMKQVNNAMMQSKLKEDIQLGEDALIMGTPTLFLDGEVDITRTKYEKYIK